MHGSTQKVVEHLVEALAETIAQKHKEHNFA